MLAPYSRTRATGFTLVELLVVVSIISVILLIAFGQYETYRAKARDGHRVSDMHNLINALEAFFIDNDRYPGVSVDGVSTGGEVVGDGSGNFDSAISPYIGLVPKDPLYDDDGSNYYYAYDPVHMDCEGDFAAALAFRRSEGMGRLTKQTTCGGDQEIDDADYNKLLYPQSP